jgi:tetratricopeptide (TPR) repeat protein
VEVLEEKVPVADWKAYKKFCDDAMVGDDQFVQLVHFDATGADAVSSDSTVAAGVAEGASSRESNAAAAKLIQEAMKSLQQMDTKSAREQLDEAKSLNPVQPKLWLAYGTLDSALGAATAAIEDFEKELKLHPSSATAYGPLAQLQMQRGLKKEAEATLRKWETLDERNPVPPKALAQLLMDDGDAPGAAAEAKAALAMTPEGEDKDEQLQYLLGQAQLKSGLKEQGRQTLVDLLARTDDAGMMNNVAYTLGDAGLELPLAEKTTRTALGKMEDESRAWTLDERPQTLLAKTQTIEATWDTLGWILYREGKMEQGESYVKAAWLNRQTAEVGEHLAEIALAKGDKNAALTDYELALSTIGWHSVRTGPMSKTIKLAGSGMPPEGTMEKELTAKVDELHKAGAKSTVQDAPAAVQKLRTLPLGPAAGLNGTAEYRLLLSAEKIERVEPTGDKTLPDGDKRVLKADFKGWLPEGSKAALVKVALLNCHSGVCELVIEP